MEIVRHRDYEIARQERRIAFYATEIDLLVEFVDGTLALLLVRKGMRGNCLHLINTRRRACYKQKQPNDLVVFDDESVERVSTLLCFAGIVQPDLIIRRGDYHCAAHASI